MVRQASCDVSDRNDKGSPDTVWQILGSCRGSFSCSKRQQHRPKIRHWLQGKKHSKVNREAFAKFPKGAFSACLLGPMFLSTGQQGSRTDSHRHPGVPQPQHLGSLLWQSSMCPEAWPPSNQGTSFSHLHTKEDKEQRPGPQSVHGNPSCPGLLQAAWGLPSRARKVLPVHSWQLLTLSPYSHSFRKLPGLKSKRK